MPVVNVNDYGAQVTYSELDFKRQVVREVRDRVCSAQIASLAAASVGWILAPISGQIIRVGCVLNGALTTGTPTLAFATDMAVALTFADIAGATALALTQAGSAAGSTFASTLGTPFTINAEKVIRVTNTVNSQATASTGTIFVVIRSTELTLS